MYLTTLEHPLRRNGLRDVLGMGYPALTVITGVLSLSTLTAFLFQSLA